MDDDSASANKRTVDAAMSDWMGGSGTALQSLLSDDVEWTITGHSLVAGTTHGRQELLARVLGPFGARFARAGDPFKPRRIVRILAEGDAVVVQFDGAGTSNDGKPYTNSYLWILQMAGSKAIRVTAFFDSISFDDLWRRVSPGQ